MGASAKQVWLINFNPLTVSHFKELRILSTKQFSPLIKRNQ